MLLVSLYTMAWIANGEEVQFKAVTDPFIVTRDASLTCSVTDYISSTTKPYGYWIEFTVNRSISNINVMANVYDNKFVSEYSFSVTNKSGLSGTSNERSCTNHINNNIISSYSIGYKNKSTDPIPLITSVSYRIYDIDSNTFTNEMIGIDGKIPPYPDYNGFNFNLNAGVICNDNGWYLLSWYHWDEYETYLQFRIAYKNKDNQYVSSSIISAKQTIIYNVSVYISSFGRSKTIMSKSNNSIFIGVYNDFEIMVDPFTEYAPDILGIIGYVHFDDIINDYNINFITNKAFMVNQIINTNNERRAFTTSTLFSDYVLLENQNCCFVILYGVSWIDEVWGANKLYVTFINDDGIHVVDNDTLIHQLGPDDATPIHGFYGNSQVTELENLRTLTESYFIISYTVNEIIEGYLRGSIYKISKQNNKDNKYNVIKLNDYDFKVYPHRIIGNDHLTLMNLCFYSNIKNNQLFTAYTIDNFTDGTSELPLIARIYDFELSKS